MCGSIVVFYIFKEIIFKDVKGVFVVVVVLFLIWSVVGVSKGCKKVIIKKMKGKMVWYGKCMFIFVNLIKL